MKRIVGPHKKTALTSLHFVQVSFTEPCERWFVVGIAVIIPESVALVYLSTEQSRRIERTTPMLVHVPRSVLSYRRL